MTDNTAKRPTSWIRRAAFAIAIVAVWELVRPLGVDVVDALQRQCPDDLILAWSHLNCEEYRHYATAVDEAGFEWQPGRHAAICVNREDRPQLITRLAEMGRFKQFPDANCPLP
ncbi:MAG: hypothetical protein RIF32_18305 [Leptospirales bacterium]|jgi:hypothetical protein